MEIYWNLELVRWIGGNKIIEENIFNMLLLAYNENDKIFMRILMYLTYSASNKFNNYKLYMIHFLNIMYPDKVIINFDKLINADSDVLNYLCHENFHQVAKNYIKVNNLTSDLSHKKKIVVYYLPKYNKKYKWSTFLFKILDDPTFNGIQ